MSAVRSVSRNSLGKTPCLLEVCSKLGRILWVFSPLSERAPKHILRKITRWRRDCSARLLVGGTPGRRWRFVFHSRLDVRCSMFDVHFSPSGFCGRLPEERPEWGRRRPRRWRPTTFPPAMTKWFFVGAATPPPKPGPDLATVAVALPCMWSETYPSPNRPAGSPAPLK